MVGILMYALVGFAVSVAAVVLVERLICWIVRLAAPILPNDIAGPEGWLIDTDRNCGVFDRTV